MAAMHRTEGIGATPAQDLLAPLIQGSPHMAQESRQGASPPSGYQTLPPQARWGGSGLGVLI